MSGIRLLVRYADTGRLVLVKRLGSRLTADTIWWDPEYRYRTSVACSWPAGTYTVKIAGTTQRPGRQSLGDRDLRAGAGREVRRARRRRARPSAHASLWYLNDTLTLAR